MYMPRVCPCHVRICVFYSDVTFGGCEWAPFVNWLQLKRDLESGRAVATAAQALAEDRITAAQTAVHVLTSQLSAQTDTVLRLEVVTSELEAARADYLREAVSSCNSMSFGCACHSSS
jgi:hypothetical protein